MAINLTIDWPIASSSASLQTASPSSIASSLLLWRNVVPSSYTIFNFFTTNRFTTMNRLPSAVRERSHTPPRGGATSSVVVGPRRLAAAGPRRSSSSRHHQPARQVYQTSVEDVPDVTIFLIALKLFVCRRNELVTADPKRI